MEKFLFFLFILFIFSGAVYEVIILSILFFSSDEVVCNFLFCEFKTIRKISSESCFQNGKMVNCSDMFNINGEFFKNNGEFYKNGK
jgi:hypothetical protein